VRGWNRDEKADSFIANAGGEWIDRAVVSDDLLVTGRKPDDIPQFDDAMIALFTAAKRPVTNVL
jgi:putative intracellular protease/amidase